MGLHREIRRIRKVGGAATMWYYARRLSNIPLLPLNLIGRPRYECPCCGWRGARFLNYVSYDKFIADYVCPRCGAHPRHRGLVLFLRQYLARHERPLAVLHFAPERGIMAGLAANAKIFYVTLDYAPHAVTVRGNIGALPFDRGAFDLIICCHVLEHLPDDATALGEIARVLAPGGTALIMAPMLPGWETQITVEFGAPQRRRHDHWRIYGHDIQDRIQAAGLNCEAVYFSSVFGRAQIDACQTGDDVIFLGSKPAS